MRRSSPAREDQRLVVVGPRIDAVAIEQRRKGSGQWRAPPNVRAIAERRATLSKNGACGACAPKSSASRSMPSVSTAKRSISPGNVATRNASSSSVRNEVIEAYSPCAGHDSAVLSSVAVQRATMAPSPMCAVIVSAASDTAMTTVVAKSRTGRLRLFAASTTRSRASSTHPTTSSPGGSTVSFCSQARAQRAPAGALRSQKRHCERFVTQRPPHLVLHPRHQVTMALIADQLRGPLSYLLKAGPDRQHRRFAFGLRHVDDESAHRARRPRGEMMPQRLGQVARKIEKRVDRHAAKLPSDEDRGDWENVGEAFKRLFCGELRAKHRIFDADRPVAVLVTARDKQREAEELRRVVLGQGRQQRGVRAGAASVMKVAGEFMGEVFRSTPDARRRAARSIRAA